MVGFLLWLVFRRDRQPLQQLRPAYRSMPYRRLMPSQVRTRRFTPVGFGRRGVDPDEVAQFLDQVAGDLARAYIELASVRKQNARIKDALRRWQSRPAPTAHELAGR
ncbi:DivIVA domain-containing protein [Plantactinospora sp. WMMB334]|uniref:DivIVA domain-containing protein n=1 Tax=Plantactinospora sp. WMMB334 TaxID=3404119 RepID=UPI003B928BDC